MIDKKTILATLRSEHSDETKPLLIAGPCSAESEEQVMNTAEKLKYIGVDMFRAGIWKPRSNPHSFEGLGLSALPWLKRVQDHYGLKVATEVATPAHVEAVLKYDIKTLWIGARTTVNPFAVQDIVNALKGVKDVNLLIKNPINPEIELWIGAIERCLDAGFESVAAVHRGFSSAASGMYRYLPMWNIPMELKRLFPEIPMICDPSHMGGRASSVRELSQKAMSLNFEGLMVESHSNPSMALSDAGQQIVPDNLKEIMMDLHLTSLVGGREDVIQGYRDEIDSLDEQIIMLLAKRMDVSNKLGDYKQQNSLAAYQSDRYNEMMKDRIEIGERMRLDRDFIKQIVEDIHTESIRLQLDKL